MSHSRQFVLAASLWLCVKTCAVARWVAVASAENATEPPPRRPHGRWRSHSWGGNQSRSRNDVRVRHALTHAHPCSSCADLGGGEPSKSEPVRSRTHAQARESATATPARHQQSNCCSGRNAAVHSLFSPCRRLPRKPSTPPAEEHREQAEPKRACVTASRALPL